MKDSLYSQFHDKPSCENPANNLDKKKKSIPILLSCARSFAISASGFFASHRAAANSALFDRLFGGRAARAALRGQAPWRLDHWWAPVPGGRQAFLRGRDRRSRLRADTSGQNKRGRNSAFRSPPYHGRRLLRPGISFQPMSQMRSFASFRQAARFRRCPLYLQWRPNLCVATNRREWDGLAVLPPRTAQRMTGGLEARGAHRHVP